MSFARSGFQESEAARPPAPPRQDAASTYTGHREEWAHRTVPRRDYAPPRQLAHLDRRDRSPGPQAYDVYHTDREAFGEGSCRQRSASSESPLRLSAWDSALSEAKLRTKEIAAYDAPNGNRSRKLGSESSSHKRSYSPTRKTVSCESPAWTPPRLPDDGSIRYQAAHTHSDGDLVHLYDWRHAVASSSSFALAEAAAKTVAEAKAEVAAAKRRERQLESQADRLKETNAQLATDLSKSSEILERLEKEVSQLRKMQGRIDAAIEAAVSEERANCERRAQQESAVLRAENAKLRKALIKSEARALEARNPPALPAPRQLSSHMSAVRMEATTETPWDQAD